MLKPLEEHDYIGLSEAPSMEHSEKTRISSVGSESKDKDLNLKATELRLGLPGSESPDRSTEWGLRCLTSGAKRGFSDAAHGCSGKWGFSGSEVEMKKSGFNGGESSNQQTQVASDDVKEERKPFIAPAAKSQVVGWPPIRSFRKNSLNANPPKKEEKEDFNGKSGSSCLYVKVSMDGAPYLRKVDLKNFRSYKDLSMALKNMFSFFTVEYVLTFEDKDGDWMLVGDLPWEMFVDACKRLRIMKSSDTIDLGDAEVHKAVGMSLASRGSIFSPHDCTATEQCLCLTEA
ncbi:unnamed protein product [Cuscuta europaea]|uniref:Auxin-responsive protein n=1 Tax=Cuscuta europaea TaxID=41803 RepID=A0A9P1DZL5_CUSEU|nr:unnamed protein product [Cuscuta europaea]